MDRLGIKKALIYSSLIGTILNEYEEQERTRAMKSILANIGKFLLITKRKQASLYFEALKISSKAWEDAIDHFEHSDKRIEGVTAINEFYGQAGDHIRRYAKVSPEMIYQFSHSYVGSVVDSYEVSDYIIRKVQEALGEPVSELSLTDKLKLLNNRN